MNKLQEIKAAQLTARKERSMVAASLLTTLIGEIETQGKITGITDEVILKVIKRFDKSTKESLDIYNAVTAPTSDILARISVLTEELQILTNLMPSKIPDSVVLSDIQELLVTLNMPAEQRSLGAISKELRAKYGEQFDGKQVSNVFKTLLGQ